MRKISRAAGLMAVLAAGSIGLGACAQGSATSGKADGVEPISMWRMFNSDDQRKEFETHFVDPWNELHPENPVELTIRDTANLYRLQRTAMASGSGPDIVFTGGPSYSLDYIRNGQVLNLNDYAEKYGWKEKFQDWAYETGVVDGGLYMVPESSEAMIMLYMPQVFEEHGWDIPEDADEFNALLKSAEDADMIPIIIGAGSWPDTPEWLVSIAFSNIAGPEATYQALSGEKPWTDPEFVDAITVLADWFHSGVIGGGSERFFTTTEPEVYSALADGTGAVYTVGSWSFEQAPALLGEMDSDDKTWDWAPFPSMTDEVPYPTFALGIGQELSINADTPHPDIVAEYLDWMISDPKGQLQATADYGAAPMPLMFDDDDFPADLDPRLKDFYLTLMKADGIGYTTWTFWGPKAHTYIVEGIDKVIVNSMTPEEYLQGLQEVYSAELADGNVPPRPNPGVSE